jgi:hypothetical protein
VILFSIVLILLVAWWFYFSGSHQNKTRSPQRRTNVVLPRGVEGNRILLSQLSLHLDALATSIKRAKAHIKWDLSMARAMKEKRRWYLIKNHLPQRLA